MSERELSRYAMSAARTASREFPNNYSREKVEAAGDRIEALEEVAEAAGAMAGELEHWIEWKNGNAIPSTRKRRGCPKPIP